MKYTTKLPRFFFAFLSLIVLTKNSFSAGYSSGLYSTSGLANSYAGSVNGIHDASDLFFNPAISSNFNKRQIVVSASYIDLDIDTDNASGEFANSTAVSGSEISDAGEDSLVPALYISSPINDKLSFGLAFTSPFGLSTKYDKNWTGRYRAIESNIKTLNINPSLSYKITPKLSVGAGVQVQYYNATLTKAAFTGASDAFAKMRGSDWGHGYNLGLQYKPTDKLSLGLGYRSKIEHKLKGRSRVAELGLYSDINASTVTPESFTFGAAYKLNNKFDFAYDATWTRWSRVKSLVANALQQPLLNDVVALNWRDSFIQSLGMNYQANGNLILRTGVAYEKDAVHDGNREPRVPTGNRFWLSFGTNYKISEGFYIDAAYVRQFYENERMNIQDSSNIVNSLNANVKTTVNAYSLGIRKEF